MENFKTIKENVSSELIEKKSKFIANVIKVESVAEAEIQLQRIKSENFGAKHNCYAYRIIENGVLLERLTDDGEPSGTAGGPMLNILKEKDLTNIIVIVTRYFGGILLGTGGLLRAYTGATLKALESATIEERVLGYEARIEIQYQDLESFKYYLNLQKCTIKNIEYNETIILIAEITKICKEEFTKKYSEKQFNILKFDILKEKYIRCINDFKEN